MKKILILASNPKGTSVLDLDKEIRDIREGIRGSHNRDRFDIQPRGAVRPKDLRYAMSEVQPQIVHFCGHGTGTQGLVLEDEKGEEELVSTEALSKLFEIFANQVECVLLNACYSEKQADEIAEHINYVIGMNQQVRDDAAIIFAVDFYKGLGDGLSIEQAFEFGKTAVQMEITDRSSRTRKLIPVHSNENFPMSLSLDYLIPVLKKKNQLTPITPSNISSTSMHKSSDDESLIGHSDWIRSLVFCDGKTLLSSSNDKTVRLWDCQTGQLLHLLTGHKDRVKCVGASPDRQIFISGSTDSQVRLWKREELPSKKTSESQRTIIASSQPLTLVNSLPIHPREAFFATGADNGKVSFWSLETGEWQRTFQAHSSAVLSLAFSPDGNILASGSANSNIKVWKLGNNSTQLLYTINHSHLSEVLSLAISPDKILVSGGADRTIKLWECENGKKKNRHILEGHAGRVWCVAISPDGTKIASASADYTVKIWKLHTGELLDTLTGHLGEVRSVAFSPDGSCLASGGDDMEIKLWRLLNL